jgi:hypothetical protein
VEVIRHVTFKLHAEQRSGVSAASVRAHEVLVALNITNLRPPPAPTENPTVV